MLMNVSEDRKVVTMLVKVSVNEVVTMLMSECE
jgi:hypothetical protein